MNKSQHTPMWQLTIGEFQQLFSDIIESKVEERIESMRKERRVVYGIKGLAELLGCSTRHASTIKNSGRLDSAIIQDGRKLILDADEVLERIQKTKTY